MLSKIKKGLKEGKTLLQFGFVKGLGLGMGMIAPLIIAKFFNPELFGSYSLAKMIIFFFTTLLITSSQTPFVVFANRERAEIGKINKTFWAQCVFLFAGILIFSILLIVFRRQISAFAGISDSDIFFMWLAYLGLTAKSFLCNLCMALGQRIKNSLIELIFGSIILISVIILGLSGKINVQTIFLVYFVSGILIGLSFISTFGFRLLLPFYFDWSHFKDMFQFTKWILLGTTAVYFINWGDNLVLRAYNITIGDIGAYNLAYSIFKGLTMFTSMIGAYFLPFVCQHIDNKNKMKIYLYNKRPKIILMGLAVIIFLYISLPHLLNFIYKDKYSSSLGIIRVLLFACLITLYNTFYGSIINALKQFKFQQITIVMQLLLNVFLNLILIPKMGTMGAAIATVLAYFCRFVALELFFRFRLKGMLKI